MTDEQLAELSRLLFSPVTLVLLVVAMLFYLYAMAFGTVGRDGAEGPPRAGRRARSAGTVLTVTATATLVVHMVLRSVASGRPPLGNMFEFSTVMVLTVLLGGLVVVQWRLRRPELMGFVLLGAVLTMGAAMLVYTEPGPIMPILDSWWRAIHVATIVFAAGVFTVGFVFAGLYLLRDSAERGAAAAMNRTTGRSTVGAAHVDDLAPPAETAQHSDGVVPGRVGPSGRGNPDDRGRGEQTAGQVRLSRAAIDPVKLAAGTWVASATLSWVFQDVGRFLAINTVMAAAALLAWWFVPYLPDAASLDSLAYRTIAFAFPVWTFAVITGAIWAEQSWGRYWGWDPKETSAFLTWVAYAGYLHSRATRSMRGRSAGWAAIVAYWVFLFTYFAVNLVVTGTLHGYA